MVLQGECSGREFTLCLAYAGAFNHLSTVPRYGKLGIVLSGWFWRRAIVSCLKETQKLYPFCIWLVYKLYHHIWSISSQQIATQPGFTSRLRLRRFMKESFSSRIGSRVLPATGEYPIIEAGLFKKYISKKSPTGPTVSGPRKNPEYLISRTRLTW